MLDVFFLPDENTLVFFERKKSWALKPNVMWCLSQVRIFFKNRFARRVPWVLKMWVKRYCWKRATPCQWWGLISIYLLSHSPSFKKNKPYFLFWFTFFRSLFLSVALQLYYWRRRRREQTCCGNNNKCCGKGFKTADTAAQAKDHYRARPESPGYTHLSFILSWLLKSAVEMMKHRRVCIVGSTLSLRVGTQWFPASVRCGSEFLRFDSTRWWK